MFEIVDRFGFCTMCRLCGCLMLVMCNGAEADAPCRRRRSRGRCRYFSSCCSCCFHDDFVSEDHPRAFSVSSPFPFHSEATAF